MRKKTRRNHFKGRRLYNGLPLVIKYDGFDNIAAKEARERLEQIMQSSAGIKAFAIPSPPFTIETLKRPRITGYRRDEMTKKIEALEKQVTELEKRSQTICININSMTKLCEMVPPEKSSHDATQKAFDDRLKLGILNLLKSIE